MIIVYKADPKTPAKHGYFCNVCLYCLCINMSNKCVQITGQYTCVCVRACVRACVCVHVGYYVVCACVRVCVALYYICRPMHACMHACMHT